MRRASIAAALLAAVGSSNQTSSQEMNGMEIGIEVSGEVVRATLADGAAARDFAAMLPLTLTLQDYAQTEKVADLPGKLSLAGEPDGFEPAAGDIAHYAPWGNLAIFHKGFRYSSGLVRLGRIEGDVGVFRKPGMMRVTITRLDD